MAFDVGAKKRAGIALVVVGILLVVAPLIPQSAPTGSGATGARAAVALTGAVVLVFGFILTRKKGHLKTPDE